MRPLLPLLVAVALTACAAPAAPADRLVDVSGAVVDAALVAGPSFSLKTAGTGVRVPYTLDRLAYVKIYARKGQPGTQLSDYQAVGRLDAVGTGDTGRVFPAVKLSNLAPNANYAVYLEGWQVLPGASDAIVVSSETLADSTTTFNTKITGYGDGAANAQVTVSGGFKLKLRNQDFAGTVTGNIAKTDGVIKPPTDEVGFQTPTPALYTLSDGAWACYVNGDRYENGDIVISNGGARIDTPLDSNLSWDREPGTNTYHSPHDSDFVLLGDDRLDYVGSDEWTWVRVP